jgi:hypothetical protein
LCQRPQQQASRWGKKQGLSLEGTWTTYRWPVHVFAFILGITEVNTYLAWVYFTGAKIEFMAFRRRLAHSLIYNKFVQSARVENEERRGRKRRAVNHGMMRAPPYARRWTGDGWDLSAKFKYQQYVCKTPGCKTPVRTYCLCSPGTWICAVCMLDHVVDEVASVASEHWIQFSILRFFLLLYFASQVRNLVMNYINDRSPLFSWQYCRCLLIWAMVSKSELQLSYDGVNIH